MESTPALNQAPPQGYTVTYEQEELQFPVYVVGFVGACFAVAGAALDNVFLIALALFAWGFAFYNFPLLEKGKPRIGAGQYQASSPRASASSRGTASSRWTSLRRRLEARCTMSFLSSFKTLSIGRYLRTGASAHSIAF